jgi:hypothetical protein
MSFKSLYQGDQKWHTRGRRGANHSEICLFLKVGANPSENFRNLTLEAFLSDSILLKKEARWVKKASSAPNGGPLKDLQRFARKSGKAEHGTDSHSHRIRIVILKSRRIAFAS